jgi:hypothetical protein
MKLRLLELTRKNGLKLSNERDDISVTIFPISLFASNGPLNVPFQKGEGRQKNVERERCREIEAELDIKPKQCQRPSSNFIDISIFMVLWDQTS